MWNKAVVKSSILFLSLALAACTSDFSNQYGIFGSTSNNTAQATSTEQGPTSNAGKLIGIGIEKSMDDVDKSKLSHALDNAPGKSTHWVNANSGASYTVEPTKKVVIDGNPYCREYHMTAVIKNNTQQYNGTACVSTDGAWHAI